MLRLIEVDYHQGPCRQLPRPSVQAVHVRYPSLLDSSLSSLQPALGLQQRWQSNTLAVILKQQVRGGLCVPQPNDDTVVDRERRYSQAHQLCEGSDDRFALDEHKVGPCYAGRSKML